MADKWIPQHLIRATESLCEKQNLNLDKKTKCGPDLGVRQGCSLSPSPFNLCIGDMPYTTGRWTFRNILWLVTIQLTRFVDVQGVLSNLESGFKLLLTHCVESVQIYKLKTKVMAFHGVESHTNENCCKWHCYGAGQHFWISEL